MLLKNTDQEICVVSHLEQYTEKTKVLQKDQNLFIGFGKHHKCITSTISRSCVTALKNAGVDVAMFGSHSTRSASTANCKKKRLSMKEINKAAGWSSSETSEKHYSKPIVDESGSFSRIVLESWSCKYIYKSCNIY